MRTPRYTDTHRYPNGYKKSAETNVQLTFRRVRAEQEKNLAEQAVKVKPIIKAKVA